MHYGCQRGTRQTFVLGVLGLYVQIETGLDVVITYVTNLPSRKDLQENMRVVSAWFPTVQWHRVGLTGA